jgi:hypothetical protein
MKANRLTLGVCLCSWGCFLTCAALVSADEPRDSSAIQQVLDAAAEEYEASLAEIMAELHATIQKIRQTAQRKGDIDMARKCEVAEQEVLESRIPPKDAIFTGAVESAQRKITRASEKLAAVFEDSAKDALRDGDLERAEAVLSEKAELLAEMKEWKTKRKSVQLSPKKNQNAQKFTPLWKTITFDYSTNNGVCVIDNAEKTFGIKFSGCGEASVYVYKDDPSLARIARVRGVLPGQAFRFSNFDSTSRSYAVAENEMFVAENKNGFYLLGRIVHVRAADRGEGVDSVTFDYTINPEGFDSFVAPPPRR